MSLTKESFVTSGYLAVIFKLNLVLRLFRMSREQIPRLIHESRAHFLAPFRVEWHSFFAELSLSKEFQRLKWWARQIEPVSLACEGSALPLSFPAMCTGARCSARSLSMANISVMKNLSH